MIQLDRIEDSEGCDLDKTDKSKECKICHYNYFDNGFKSDSKICNRCDWGIKSFENLAIIHLNYFSHRFFMFGMSSSIYNVIRPVLNFLFFYDKISQAPKSTKKHQKVTKSTKRH